MSDTAPLLHRRSVEVNCYDEGDYLHAVGRLRDERPWYDLAPVLHDMELSLRVRVADMIITSADAVMHTFPHEECPFIAPKFAELEGLSITRGFTRSLRELFAGVSGCQHLHELARVSGPAIFQAASSKLAQGRVAAGEPPTPEQLRRVAARMSGTCHIWAPDGVGEQKLAAGWRPGGSTYPAPTVEKVRLAHQPQQTDQS